MSLTRAVDAKLLAALAPLALSAALEAKAARALAASRRDEAERIAYLDRAARWQALYEAAADALEDSVPMHGYAAPPYRAARQMEAR